MLHVLIALFLSLGFDARPFVCDAQIRDADGVPIVKWSCPPLTATTGRIVFPGRANA